MKSWMKKPFCRAACFVLLAALALWYVTGLLWKTDGTSMGFYAEPADSLDVVFLGSSKSNTAVSPTAMYRAQGFTGYVMYNWSQTPWAVYYYARQALARQKPSVLVVEGNLYLYGARDGSYTDEINGVSNINALKIPFSADRLALAFAMQRCQTDHPSVFTLSALYRSHANWKGFSPANLLWFAQKPAVTVAKGSGPLYVHEAFAAPAPPADAAPDASLYAPSAAYLDRLLALGKSRGVSLVFAIYPDCSYTDADYAHLAWLRAHCAQQGAAVVDFTNPAAAAAAGLDYAADMADYSHVNHLGTARLSAYLGRWLDAQYALPDHRGDAAYAQWESAAARNARDDADMLVKTSASLDALLHHAAGPEYLTFVYAVGDMTAADPGTLRQTFASLGMDPAVFVETDAARLWVWQNGRGTETPSFTLASSGGEIAAAPGTVTVNGAEQSYARAGINVVVLDAASGRWIQTITWDTAHGYASFTR